MHEITCPHCQEKLDLNQAGLARVLKQVRDKEFEAEIKDRLASAEKEKTEAIKLVKAETHTTLQKQISQKETELLLIKAQLQQTEVEKRLAVTEATRYLEKERDVLTHRLNLRETETRLLETTYKERLNSQLKAKDDLLKIKEEEVAFYKDNKLKLSTKQLGESLEQHCENEFNKLRATAFENAYFEKDNDVRQGTKGDYIYREYDETGCEFVSIMFEMKTQNDETTTKKKNEDFFQKLHEDRVKKKCEYAVLVSLLEPESEYYNQGIVEVSRRRFPKMYVVRPQLFITLISLLRNAARNTLEYKIELDRVKNQNLDITNFENQLVEFKGKFGKNYASASRNFQEAIAEIDKSIARMQAAKRKLTTSENQLRLANQKIAGLTVKKLTRNNPTMQAKFAAIESKEEDDK